MEEQTLSVCQSSCLIGFLFNHKSLKIGFSNVERIFTCHWLAKLWQEVMNLKNEINKQEVAKLFGEEFHTPSHIFLCIENVKCVMLCKDGDNFGALPPKATKAWASRKNIPFLISLDIINALQGGTRS
ncbi:unnamed protein product [Sphagnum jensenii]|uniref:Uncharacterized protein n=1 Tax=Sphagnum jensenii TaxID=128206 RepID=A0ABP1B9R3_9BRYO